ncbi:helix-turn-helix domain-containing protein [Alkalihalobacillus sp. 1P02AB]|uniref:AraC family transcriptional regulator n=1 Tax=Alkalihalobacillus sp. 1P02AB TaxID=3132260 RepID=UPI0039A4F580
MNAVSDFIATPPIVPFIRLSDFAIRKPWSVSNRRLLDYLLIYVQEGRCTVRVDEVKYDLNSGDFCLIQPNTVHSLHGTTNTITPFAHMDFFYNHKRENSFPVIGGQLDLTGYEELMQPKLDDTLNIHVPVKFHPENPIEFRDKMLRMIECWQNDTLISHLEAQCLASELILSIFQAYSQTNYQSPSTLRTFNWITSYLFFSISESLSVSDMAQRANLSPSRFSAIFKKKFGISPYQYLLNLRIKHAKELLKTSQHSLEDITVYCGFSDVHHFSKSFKKNVGESPSVYRQNSLWN